MNIHPDESTRNTFLIVADNICDYIPGISTLNNVTDLFLKCVIKSDKKEPTNPKNRYYTYVKRKSLLRCILLLIPVLGNIAVGIYDLVNRKDYLLKNPENNSLNTQGVKSLSGLEEINLQTSDKGCKGRIIFVDVTSKDGKLAAHSIKQMTQEQEKALYSIDRPKTCHFGFACCFNFSIALANRSDKIILFDYDPIVVKFNRIVRDQLKISSNKTEFKANLISACKEDQEIAQRDFFPRTNNNSTIENLGCILDGNDFFLSKEEDFLFIKKIAETGNLHIFQGSIYDEKIIEHIAYLAKIEGVKFSSIFISNVYDWNTDKEKQDLLLENMAKLSDGNTLIIDVVPSRQNHWTINVAHYLDPQTKQSYTPKAARKASSKNPN